MGGVKSRRVTAFIAAAVLVSVAGACRKNPAGDGPYAQEVADAVPRIEQATGLKFKRPPTLELRTREHGDRRVTGHRKEAIRDRAVHPLWSVDVVRKETGPVDASRVAQLCRSVRHERRGRNEAKGSL